MSLNYQFKLNDIVNVVNPETNILKYSGFISEMDLHINDPLYRVHPTNKRMSDYTIFDLESCLWSIEYIKLINLKLIPGKFYRDNFNGIWCCYNIDLSCKLHCQADCMKIDSSVYKYFYIDGRHDSESIFPFCLMEECEHPSMVQ